MATRLTREYIQNHMEGQVSETPVAVGSTEAFANVLIDQILAGALQQMTSESRRTERDTGTANGYLSSCASKTTPTRAHPPNETGDICGVYGVHRTAKRLHRSVRRRGNRAGLLPPRLQGEGAWSRVMSLEVCKRRR